MALKLPTEIFLFLQKMNLGTMYFKPIVAQTLAHTLYPTASWDEVCDMCYLIFIVNILNFFQIMSL